MLLYVILNEQLICMKRPEYFSVWGSFHNLQVCPPLASIHFCDFYFPDQDEKSFWPFISFHLIYSKIDAQSLPQCALIVVLFSGECLKAQEGSTATLETGVQFCFTNVCFIKKIHSLPCLFHSVHSCLECPFFLLSSTSFFNFIFLFLLFIFFSKYDGIHTLVNTVVGKEL